MKLTRDALAILELPRQHANTLPGFGWESPDEDGIKINTDAGISLTREWVEREGLLDRRPVSSEHGANHTQV
jgi:hypothetical protein